MRKEMREFSSKYTMTSTCAFWLILSHEYLRSPSFQPSLKILQFFSRVAKMQFNMHNYNMKIKFIAKSLIAVIFSKILPRHSGMYQNSFFLISMLRIVYVLNLVTYRARIFYNRALNACNLIMITLYHTHCLPISN